MKIPRDISSEKLIKALSKYGYKITHQTGSHVRLTSQKNKETHHITIPKHKILKIGTLNNILNDLSDYLEIDKQTQIEQLFSS
jgi:predicted RNA binding protein YcfA (HicA-like mRNA interferase family)